MRPSSGDGAGARRWLIVNADDFGASAGVNTGIIRAHEQGIVTSTSLMVTMPAAAEAAMRARVLPDLSLGIHIDLTGEGIPAPVDLENRDQCRREIRSQLERFVDLVGGLPTHIDSHHNIHRTPHLTALFVELSAALGLPLREHSAVRYFPDFYGQWDDGDTHPEWIGTTNLIRMLVEEIGPGVTELSCHPGIMDPALESSYHRERQIELETLCDPLIRDHVRRSDLTLIGYRDLRGVLSENRL